MLIKSIAVLRAHAGEIRLTVVHYNGGWLVSIEDCDNGTTLATRYGSDANLLGLIAEACLETSRVLNP